MKTLTSASNFYFNTSSVLQLQSETFEFDTCGKSFKIRAKLRHHMRRTHLGENYRCNFCPDTFTSKFNQQRHERNKHLGDQKFACETCHEEFVTKYQLQGHQRSRHKIGSLICPECGKIFPFLVLSENSSRLMMRTTIAESIVVIPAMQSLLLKGHCQCTCQLIKGLNTFAITVEKHIFTGHPQTDIGKTNIEYFSDIMVILFL